MQYIIIIMCPTRLFSYIMCQVEGYGSHAITNQAFDNQQTVINKILVIPANNAHSCVPSDLQRIDSVSFYDVPCESQKCICLITIHFIFVYSSYGAHMQAVFLSLHKCR